MTSPLRNGGSPEMEDELLEATYRALSKHGYANLTISRIERECSKSSSNIYHHYENKAELVASCLDMLLTQVESEFEASVRDCNDDVAVTRLERIVNWLFRDRSPDEWKRTTVLLQLQVQARHDDRLHNRFMDAEQVVHECLATSLRTDIEESVLQSVNLDDTAAFILTTAIGFLTQQVTTDDVVQPTVVRTELDQYLDEVS